MSLLNINVRDLVNIITAPVHRLTPVIDLLESLLDPFGSKAGEVNIIADDQLTRATWTGQFIVMREAIEFFTGITGITITNVDSLFEGYLYLTTDPGSATEIGTKAEGLSRFFQGSGETISTVNFIIGVPVADYTSAVEDQIRSEVDIFALANGNYEIITI
jgi:hypothetical protein